MKWKHFFAQINFTNLKLALALAQALRRDVAVHRRHLVHHVQSIDRNKVISAETIEAENSVSRAIGYESGMRI